MTCVEYFEMQGAGLVWRQGQGRGRGRAGTLPRPGGRGTEIREFIVTFIRFILFLKCLSSGLSKFLVSFYVWCKKA